MEGTLIQMRVNSSGCSQDVPAVGTFSTVENDVFLEKFSCFNMTAVSQRYSGRSKVHQYVISTAVGQKYSIRSNVQH
jgi:hypothetical protein